MRKASPYCVAEIGGLATEVLYLVKREIRFVQTYNTGSLRIRQQLQNSGIPDKRMTEVAEGQAKEMALSLVQNIRDLESLKLVLLGREMRFAASRILPDWNGEGLCTVPVSDLAKLVSGIVAQPLDELARIHQFAYPDAETLGPALMIALRMAKAMSLKTVSVGGMSFCDGLVIEAVDELAWNKRVSRHILRIAQESGLKYRHDARGHHKHSMYIIQHMEFPGLSSHIINLIAFVARYHRKAVPLPIHQDYNGASPRRPPCRVQTGGAVARGRRP